MMWRNIKFGFKDFRSHMNVRDNVTLKGMLKRMERKNPKPFRVMKKSLAFVVLYTLGMFLIPGSKVPFQKEIKHKVFQSICVLSSLWHYNILDPSIEQYLITINEIILSEMKNNIYDTKLLCYYFQTIKSVVEQERFSITKSMYWNLLLYGETILENLIRFDHKQLLNPDLYDYLKWVYEETVKNLNDYDLKLENQWQIDKFYTVFLFLVKFGKQEDQLYVLSSLKNKNKQEKNIGSFIKIIKYKGLSHQKLQRELKQMYTQTENSDIKRQVINFFQELDQIYRQQQNKKPKII